MEEHANKEIVMIKKDDRYFEKSTEFWIFL